MVGGESRAGSRHLPARASRPTTIPSTRRRRRSRRWSTKAVASADITKPTKDPVPYIGIQYVAIPEFQGIGTTVGQQIAAALAGQVTVDAGAGDGAALDRADDEAGRLLK